MQFGPGKLRKLLFGPRQAPSTHLHRRSLSVTARGGHQDGNQLRYGHNLQRHHVPTAAQETRRHDTRRSSAAAAGRRLAVVQHSGHPAVRLHVGGAENQKGCAEAGEARQRSEELQVELHQRKHPAGPRRPGRSLLELWRAVERSEVLLACPRLLHQRPARRQHVLERHQSLHLPAELVARP